MGYCWTCGWHTDAMTAPADLDPDTRMCRWCRDNWRPAGSRPGDLGYHAQPQPLGVMARDGSRTRMPQGVHGDLVSGRDSQASRQLPHRVNRGPSHATCTTRAITSPMIRHSRQAAVSFGFGPEWARDTGCCGKPAGCTNTSPDCLMRGHPWKRRHVVTPDQTVPFRAGGLDGETPAPAAARVPHAVAASSVVLLADVSEFQHQIVDQAYLAWSKAIVVRAMYGTRVDKAWFGGERRAALHAGGAKFIGLYQYITSQDVTAQAKALVSLLGRLRPGEKVIADLEEGPGNQQARWVTWAKVINAALGDPPWDYSGLNYAAAHGLQPVTWVAAYGPREPDPPHQLWQFTDAFQVPGVGVCDCSVFHGTIDDLAALAYQGKTVPPAAFHGEYTTAGQYSLAQLAAKLGVMPSSLLRMTAVRYGTFGDALAAYENALHAGTRPPSAPLPAGIKFWVD